MRSKGLAASAAETLFPGYFALVMATAAVSIASFLLGHALIARLLLGLNWIFYVALWALTLIRIACFPARVLDDLFDHQRAPGFFTLVAGTCVLATQTALIVGGMAIAVALWWLGLTLWFVIMYAFFTAVMVRRKKPTLARTVASI